MNIKTFVANKPQRTPYGILTIDCPYNDTDEPEWPSKMTGFVIHFHARTVIFLLIVTSTLTLYFIHVPGTLSKEINRPLLKSNHSSLSSVKVKNVWSFTSLSPIHRHNLLLRPKRYLSLYNYTVGPMASSSIEEIIFADGQTDEHGVVYSGNDVETSCQYFSAFSFTFWKPSRLSLCQ
jgi:hypothetical protein